MIVEQDLLQKDFRRKFFSAQNAPASSSCLLHLVLCCGVVSIFTSSKGLGTVKKLKSDQMKPCNAQLSFQLSGQL
jgi:hypothetical protein